MQREFAAESVPSLEELVRLHRAIEAALRGFVETEIDVSFHGVSPPKLHKVVTDYVTRLSKHFVGLLFLLTYRAFVPPAVLTDPALISVATALEIRHAAILLHDDIVDQDEQRGSMVTAHKALEEEFGPEAPGAALFAGDALCALSILPILESSLSEALRLRLAGLMTSFTCRTSIGQAEQLFVDTVPTLDSLSEDHILDTHASHMEATTTGCSMTMAAVAARATADEIDVLRQVARPLAAAFQVQNDLASFRELRRQLTSPHKDVVLANTSDVGRRRRTVLMKAAMQCSEPAPRTSLVRFMAGDDTIELAKVVEIVSGSSAEECVEALIARLFDASRAVLVQDQRLHDSLRLRLLAVYQFMMDLYDPSSELDRLHISSRPDLCTK